MTRRLGMTILEVAVAAAIIGVVVLGFSLFQVATVKANQRDRERTFALQKATQIMEELKAKVAGDANTALDDYGQADTTYSYILTTDASVNNPLQPLSDNITDGAGYRFVRQIWVRPLPRDKGARQVTVRVFRSTAKATPGVKAGAKPLAVIANVFKSVPNIVVPTQQYDFYMISCAENTLGKNDYCAYPWATAYEDYINSGATYLAGATSGLSIIERKIRLTSYGRDAYYSPLQNDHDYWTWYYDNSKGATIDNPNNVPLGSVYFRPGINVWWDILSPGAGQSSYWFNPTTMTEPTAPTRYAVAHGNTAASLFENQPNYTFADQNNHAVRYFENIEKQKARGPVSYPGVSWTSYRWSPDPYELTLRGMLDEMLEGKRKNAILVNGHGQLFPFIPMRNYSDAAKVPSNDADLTALAANWGVTAASAADARDGSHCRVVTHPRSLEYDANDVVELRVFPYLSDPQYIKNLYGGGTTEPPSPYRDVTIVLRGMRDNLANWNGGAIANNIEIQSMQGIKSKGWVDWGLNFHSDNDEILAYNDVDNIIKGKGTIDPAVYGTGLGQWSMNAYRWARAYPASGSLRPTDSPAVSKGKPKGKGKGLPIPYLPAAASHVASVSVQPGNDPANGLLDGDVIIKLKDVNYTPTPIDGKESGTDVQYGIDKDCTLYGQNYFPDPLLPDLSDGWKDSDKHPRNTARYRILFKTNKAMPVEVITTIGSDANLLHHQAPNRSRTWVWVGTPAPETERYQLVGDPRHNPYDDVRDEKRYNRYFGDLDDAYFVEAGDTDWNCFADTADGWGPNVANKGRADVDVPRYFEIWRKALFKANAMLATPNANAFQVIALGGEYGTWDRNSTVTHSKKPMTGEDGKRAAYDEWTNPTIVCSKDKKWVSKPWLGEMYPDDEWSKWQASGNLPSDDYRRLEYQDVDAFQKAFPDGTTFKHTKYLDGWGPMSFYNATTQFTFADANGNASIAGAGLPNPTDGKAVSADLKALLRETPHSYRSFTWNDGGATPPQDYASQEAKDNRTTIEPGLVNSTNKAYYLAKDGNKAVAPFVVRRGGQAFYNLAFTPWNNWNGANDPYSMMRMFAACTLQGYLDMASPTFANGGNKDVNRIRLLPRVKVTKPEDDALVTGTSLAIEWTPEWKRWDGADYSRQYANYGLDGDQPTLRYMVKYSEDGKSWRYADGVSAGGNVGAYARYDASSAKSTGNPFFTLNTAGFKNKQYQIRVEAWRVDPGYESVNHSYAQFSINYTK